MTRKFSTVPLPRGRTELMTRHLNNSPTFEANAHLIQTGRLTALTWPNYAKFNPMERTSKDAHIHAPVIALDLGEKRVGVAVSDALSISITRLSALPRTNWKQLVRDVVHLI